MAREASVLETCDGQAFRDVVAQVVRGDHGDAAVAHLGHGADVQRRSGLRVQTRDHAQLRSLLMLETGFGMEKFESVRYYAGFPMSAHHVVSGVKARLEKAA